MGVGASLHWNVGLFWLKQTISSASSHVRVGRRSVSRIRNNHVMFLLSTLTRLFCQCWKDLVFSDTSSPQLLNTNPERRKKVGAGYWTGKGAEYVVDQYSDSLHFLDQRGPRTCIEIDRLVCAARRTCFELKHFGDPIFPRLSVATALNQTYVDRIMTVWSPSGPVNGARRAWSLERGLKAMLLLQPLWNHPRWTRLYLCVKTRTASLIWSYVV